MIRLLIFATLCCLNTVGQVTVSPPPDSPDTGDWMDWDEWSNDGNGTDDWSNWMEWSDWSDGNNTDSSEWMEWSDWNDGNNTDSSEWMDWSDWNDNNSTDWSEWENWSEWSDGNSTDSSDESSDESSDDDEGGDWNIFDEMAPHINGFFAELQYDEMWDKMLSNGTDGNGLSQGINMILEMLKKDFNCWEGSARHHDGSGKCHHSNFIGCNCADTWSKLKDPRCAKMPCTVLKHVSENLATLLWKIRYAGSVSDVMENFVKFKEPIQEELCHCNHDVFESIAKCVKRYNGPLMNEMPRKDKKALKKALRKKLAWDKFQYITTTAVGSLCQNGCSRSFDMTFNAMAHMFDNSINYDTTMPQCHNFRHISGAVVNFIMAMEKHDVDAEDFDENTFVNWIMKKSMSIPTALWCWKEECVGHFAEIFNNCCSRVAMDMTVTKKMVSNMVGWVKSLFNVIDPEAWIPKIEKKTKDKMIEKMDPSTACKKKMYRNTTEMQCS